MATIRGPERVYQAKDFAPRFVELSDYAKPQEELERIQHALLSANVPELQLDPVKLTGLPLLSKCAHISPLSQYR